MITLEQSIHKDLKIIINKMIICDDAKEFDSLAGIYEVLNNIAKANNIYEIRYPDIYKKYQSFNIDNIVERLNEKTLSNLNRNYKLNKRYANITNELKAIYNNNKHVPEYKTTINHQQTIDYALDFYKYYDNEIYAYLKDYLKYNKVFFLKNIINVAKGCMVDTRNNIVPYVFIEETNNVCEFLTLVHELIHIYFQNIEKNYTFDQQINKNTNNFGEVYSSFIELMALDYIKDNNFNKDDIYSYKVDYDNSLIEDLALYKHYLVNKKIMIKYMELLLNVEQYSYGKGLAYHFYDQYINNKETAKNNIKQFTLDYKEKNKKYLLNNYGLSQTDVFSSKTLKKYIY